MQKELTFRETRIGGFDKKDVLENFKELLTTLTQERADFTQRLEEKEREYAALEAQYTEEHALNIGLLQQIESAERERLRLQSRIEAMTLENEQRVKEPAVILQEQPEPVPSRQLGAAMRRTEECLRRTKELDERESELVRRERRLEDWYVRDYAGLRRSMEAARNLLRSLEPTIDAAFDQALERLPERGRDQ